MSSQRIGYIRASSLDQNVERQLDGIHLDKVFTDKASVTVHQKSRKREKFLFARLPNCDPQ